MRHFVGQAEATHDKGVICRPSELLGQGDLEGKVSEGLYVEGRQYEGRQYAVQPLCRSKND
jgi:hypothetical protein